MEKVAVGGATVVVEVPAMGDVGGGGAPVVFCGGDGGGGGDGDDIGDGITNKLFCVAGVVGSGGSGAGGGVFEAESGVFRIGASGGDGAGVLSGGGGVI